MTTTKRIVLIDASSLKLSACKLQLKLTVIDGYRHAINYNDIEFGSAFHTCAKTTALSEGNIGFGIIDALTYWRNTKMKVKEKKKYLDESFLVKTCQRWYEEMWLGDTWLPIKDSSGKALVEYRFHHPFWQTELTEVLLCGTIDKICRHQTQPILAIGDYKTTSLYDEKEFFASYLLSPQLFFYSRAIKKEVELAGENNVLFPFKKTDLYNFIDGIFLKGKDTPTVFKRSEMVKVNNDKLDIFEMLLEKEVKEFVETLESNNALPTGMINGACETKFGKCNYFNYCTANNSNDKEMILRQYFIQRKYNPAEFGELIVEKE